MRFATLIAFALAFAFTSPLRAEGLTADVAGGLGEDAGFRGGLAYWGAGGIGFGGYFEDLDHDDNFVGSPVETESDFFDIWVGWMSDEGWGVAGGYWSSTFGFNTAAPDIDGDGFYGRVFFAGPVPMGEDTEEGWFEIGAGFWDGSFDDGSPTDGDGNGLVLDGMIWIPFGDGWGGYAQGNLGWETDDLPSIGAGGSFNANPQRVEGGITYEFSAGWVGYVAYRNVDFGFGSGWASTADDAGGIWIGLHIMPEAWETEGMEGSDY